MKELVMDPQMNTQLIDDVLEAYVDWREECAEVWDAYERWVSADEANKAGAFAAYCAALDREECASRAYAGLMGTARGGGPTLDVVGRVVDALGC